MHQENLDTTVLMETSSPLSVLELTQAIKSFIEERFYAVYVQGEISNCKLHSSGHLYFDLKDSDAKIPAVAFRVNSLGLPRLPKEGDQVILKGHLSLYPPHGRYQLIVSDLQFAGLGALLLKFEELKKKLSAMGWFDRAHKKPLPLFPKTIGVVTSPTGAVIKDIIHVLRRRHPGFHLILAPVLVQGPGAAEQIAEAIALFNKEKCADVLIVGRGGGSLEDLWAFNEWVVAKAIFESQIPIISAVGHETDVTLADFVADVRAPTPSAAAEMVMPEKALLTERLIKMRLHADRLMKLLIEKKRKELTALSRHPLLASPHSLLHLPMQKLDMLRQKLDATSSFWLKSKKERFNQVALQIKALDPKRVLKRGYSILFDKGSGHIITSANQTPTPTKVKAILADGELNLEVHP